MSNPNHHDLSGSPDPQSVIRDLRIKIGLLQSELEHLRREHAALKQSIISDVAVLARRYLEPGKQTSRDVRAIDGVIFGGWDRLESGEGPALEPVDPSRETRRA